VFIANKHFQIMQDKKMHRWILSCKWRYRLAVFLLGLVGIHAAIGFMIVPWLIRGPLLDRVDAMFVGDFSLQRVTFNPFTFRLTAEGFRVGDGEGSDPALVLERLDVNVRAWASLLLRSALFDEIVLQGPGLFVDIAEDGSVNLARVFALLNPVELEEASEVSAVERLEALANKHLLRIDRFELVSGVMRFRDLRVGEGFDFQADDLRFVIDDFVSEPSVQNTYEVLLRGSQGLELRWAGQFSLFPLRSEAQMQISGMRPGLLQPYLSEILPLLVKEGAVAVELDYIFAPLDEPARVAVGELGFAFTDLKLALVEEPQRVFLDLPRIELLGFNADLYAQSIAVEQVAVAIDFLGLRRGADGRIDLLELVSDLPAGEANVVADEHAERVALIPERAIAAAFEQLQVAVRSPWTLSLGVFNFDLNRLELIDETRLDAPLALEALALSATDLKNHGSGANRLNMSARVSVDGGSVEASFETAADFTRIDATFIVERLALKPFAQLLASELPLKLDTGHSSSTFNASVEMGSTADVPPLIQVRGDARLDDVLMRFPAREEPFAEFASILLDGIHFSNLPLGLQIERLRFETPSIRLKRDEYGVLDLVGALESLRAEPVGVFEDNGQGLEMTVGENSEFSLRVGKVEVEAGGFVLNDFAAGAEPTLIGL
jgi:hypothetical protein